MSKKRLPPGAAAVLINQNHTYTDLFMPIDSAEKRLFDGIDGNRCIGDIVESALSGQERTRVRDLVDMVLLIQSGTLEEARVGESIRVTFERRKTHSMLSTLPAPPADGQKPYVALAHECGLSGQVGDAFEILRTFAESIIAS